MLVPIDEYEGLEETAEILSDDDTLPADFVRGGAHPSGSNRAEAAEVAAVMEDLRASGDVLRLHLGRRQGHEPSGVRYGVVVQSYALMRLSMVLVAPTSTAARGASSEPEIGVGDATPRVLVVTSNPRSSGSTSPSKPSWTCGSQRPTSLPGRRQTPAAW